MDKFRTFMVWIIILSAFGAVWFYETIGIKFISSALIAFILLMYSLLIG